MCPSFSLVGWLDWCQYLFFIGSPKFVGVERREMGLCRYVGVSFFNGSGIVTDVDYL